MKPRNAVREGRYTATHEGDVTVFLIGMRINKIHRPDKWLPIFLAMPRMLTHLSQHPEAGLLSFESWLGRTTMLLSYWRSPEDLNHFATDAEAPHLQPWRDFRRRVGDGGDVGIWHETYVVSPDKREVVYANMPLFGLAAATSQVPVGAALRTAKQRMAHPGLLPRSHSRDRTSPLITMTNSPSSVRTLR